MFRIIESSLAKIDFLDKTLTHYHRCTMSTWGQTEKSIKEWFHHIRDIRIKSPGSPTILTPHHPPTLEDSTYPTKNNWSSKIAHIWIPSHQKFFTTLICKRVLHRLDEDWLEVFRNIWRERQVWGRLGNFLSREGY